MTGWRRSLTVFSLFAGLTLAMTFPLALHLRNGLTASVDTLLNTWILSENIDKISRLSFRRFFDGTIFYPHSRTLAYSEFLIPQSLLVLPVLLVSRNPILAYNVAVLLAFLTTGLGMFALARTLVRNDFAAVAAGVIFAFCPFMFDHLSHLQVLTAGGIPLTFLFIHKFFDAGKTRDILLAAFFYVLQFMANGYYGLFLTLFAGLLAVILAVSKKTYKDKRFWLRIGLFCGLAAAVIGPFLYQYLRLRWDMGFSRMGAGGTAGLASFLAAPAINVVYGKMTAIFRGDEAQLFPGLAALGLAVLGLARSRKSGLDKVVLASYSVICGLAFLFTFGEKGPYLLLFKNVPGFDGLRVPARFHIFVMFSLAVLAAAGIQSIFPRGGRSPKIVPKAALILVILAEYASFPLSLNKVPVKSEIPEVYQWLAARREDVVVIELPLTHPGEKYLGMEAARNYYSLYHRKRIVNGYSGYSPPLYDELCRRWWELPAAQNIADLQTLGVDLIIIHAQDLPATAVPEFLAEAARYDPGVRSVAVFGSDVVISIPRREARGGGSSRLKPEFVPKAGWRADASLNAQSAGWAIDGSLSTRWESGPQRSDSVFSLDLGGRERLRGLSLRFGRSPMDYPRGYRVDVSEDGIRWDEAARQDATVIPILDFLNPKTLSLDIAIPEREARFIRITDTGRDPVYYWSIYEVDVWR